MNYIFFTEKFKKAVADADFVNVLMNKLNSLGKLADIGHHKWVSHHGNSFFTFSYRPSIQVVLQKEATVIDGQEINIIAVLNAYSGREYEKKWDRVNIELYNKRYPSLDKQDIEKAKQEYLAISSKEEEKATLPESLITYAYHSHQIDACDIFESDIWIDKSPEFRKYWYEIGEVLFDIIWDFDLAKRKYDIEEEGYLINTESEEVIAITVRLNQLEEDKEGIHFSVIRKKQFADKKLESFALIDIGWQSSSIYRIEKLRGLKGKIFGKEFKHLFPKGYPLEYFEDAGQVRTNFFRLQNNSISSIALSEEQLTLLSSEKSSQPPRFVNGQAGSGKTVILYYQYALAFELWFEHQEHIREVNANINPPVFITATPDLTAGAYEAVKEIVKNQLKKEDSKSTLLYKFQNDGGEEELKRCFKQYDEFLQELLLESDLSDEGFQLDFKVDFNRFEDLYQDCHIPELKPYSAELAWYVIYTYIRGHGKQGDYLTPEKYESSPVSKDEKLDLEAYRVIYKQGWQRFYSKKLRDCSADGRYWDQLSLVHYLIDNLEGSSLHQSYIAVFCDEAQDFTRIELELLFKLSSYVQYQLPSHSHHHHTPIPIVFAGDPNQTVNPTGFNLKRVEGLFNEQLKNIYGEYYKEGSITSELPTNYRSAPYIVNFANIIQALKSKLCDLPPQIQQSSNKYLLSKPNAHHSFQLYYKEQEQVKEKIANFPVIVPSELGSVQEYADETLDEQSLMSPFAAKGSEYNTVVLYQFGHYFKDRFGKSLTEMLSNKEDISVQAQMKLAFFFTKLYVSITRAKEEIILLDTEEGYNSFWKELILAEPNIRQEFNTQIKDREISLELLSFTENNSEIWEIIEEKDRFAKENAFEDLRKGLANENAYKLENAQYRFAKLDRKGETDHDYKKIALLCEAKKSEIQKEWIKAANRYTEAGYLYPNSNEIQGLLDNYKEPLNFSNATWCYWLSGKSWNGLIRVLSDFKTQKAELQQLWGLRLLVSKVMQGENFSLNEFENYLWVSEKIFTDTPIEEYQISWIGSFYEKLRLKVEKEIGQLESIDCDGIIEVFQKRKDTSNKDYSTLMGSLCYRARKYQKAVEYWHKADIQIQGTTEYKQALLKLAEESRDLPEIIHRNYDLHQYKEVTKNYESLKNVGDLLSESHFGEVAFAYIGQQMFEKAFHVPNCPSLGRLWDAATRLRVRGRARFLEQLIVYLDQNSSSKLLGNSAEEDQHFFAKIRRHILELGKVEENDSNTQGESKNRFGALLSLKKIPEGISKMERQRYREARQKKEREYENRGKGFIDQVRKDEDLLLLVSNTIRMIARSQMEYADFAAIQESVMTSKEFRERDVFFRNLVWFYIQHYYLTPDSRKDLVNIFELAVAFEKTSDERNDAIKLYGETIFKKRVVMDSLPQSLQQELITFAQRRWAYHWKEKALWDRKIKTGDPNREEMREIMQEFDRDWKQYIQKYNLPSMRLDEWESLNTLPQTPVLPKKAKQLPDIEYTNDVGNISSVREAGAKKEKASDVSPEKVEDAQMNATAQTSQKPPYIYEIYLENFKQFVNVEVKNIGQFNLVLGANNVGKTSFLEAFSFSENIEDYVANLLYIYSYRNGIDSLHGLFPEKFIDTFKSVDLQEGTISIIAKYADKNTRFTLREDNEQVVLNALEPHQGENESPSPLKSMNGLLNDFATRFDNTSSIPLEKRPYQTEFFRQPSLFPIIPFGQGYGIDLLSFYSNNINSKSLKKKLIENLSVFIPEVDDIEKRDMIEIYEKGRDRSLSISQYGEGANKLFRILLQIMASKDGRLMIDEIDAGIHRWKFHDFWRTILKAANRYNVQLFATTHNTECVTFFAKALEESGMEEMQEHARTITLYKTIKNEIKARVRAFDSFDQAVNEGRNLMGGE